MAESFQAPMGLVAMTSPGSIRVETAMSLCAMGQHSIGHGLKYDLRHFGGSLVDKARNDACRAALSNPSIGWLAFVDGDMVAPPDSMVRLVETAYAKRPEFDILGGWCPLRGNAVPTIDTGTGTWESHYPRSGVLEVIRTGGAFLLIKRHVLEKMTAPWFGVRNPMRWLDALCEIDNFARTKYDGKNPFYGPEWRTLMDMASADPQSQQPTPGYEIGEDSGFCDRAKALGFRIAVDTDIEIVHVDVEHLNGEVHKERMDKRRVEMGRIHGVLVPV